MRRAILLASVGLPLLLPLDAMAATATIDSRNFAITQNLSANAIVVTGGYHVPGDGGGAMFKNVGASPLADTGASFTDSNGTNWQYIPDPHGIHVRQFGAKCDWNIAGDGNRNYAAYDAVANDDSAAIQNAINFAGREFANGEDRGGGAGSYVRLPKGSCKLSSPIRVLNDVILAGEGALSSVLVMPQSFDGAAHFVVLGSLDPGPTELASFGARLEELGLWSVNLNASYNVAMAFTSKTQHTGGFARIKILAGNRVGIYMTRGAGGASMFHMQDIEVYNMGAVNGANPNPGIILDYRGSSISNLRNIVVQGPSVESGGPSGPHHVGIRIESGVVNIDGFHTENIATGILVNVTTAGDGGVTRLHNLTGGSLCTNLVLIQSFVPQGSTVVGMASKNGCTNTLDYGISNFSPITTKIVADELF